MKNKIVVVYSSHLDESIDIKFEEHLKKTCGVSLNIHRYENKNQYSLSEVYNKAIDEIDMTDAITVFCHNDIEFDTKNWGKNLLKHFNNFNNNYQIIGVAGTEEIYYHGCWWLTPNAKSMNLSKMIGIVNHDNGIRKWESRYSESYFGIRSVVCVDGLFIAVDCDDIEAKWDEDFDGFHYYDIGFSVKNYLEGCNIGVITDIRITHKSIGQTNEQWEINRQKFVEKYKHELPIILEK